VRAEDGPEAPDPAPPLTYADSGVDTEAGDRAVDLMKGALAAATRPEVVGGLGGFAGLFDAAALGSMTHPVLATSTDGVGTKVAVAQALDAHDTIGIDLVGMVVDDIVVCGAEPLFMTDYIACGRVVPARTAAIVKGIADGCAQAGVALVGGETAEHPGLLDPTEYDLAGAATGVVERSRILGPERVASDDVVLALASSGLHSNGYSLVRRVVARAGLRLEQHVDEIGRSLGEELLEPTRIYTPVLRELIDATDVGVHALSHITGGGLAANVARVLPPGLHVTMERRTWTPAPVFDAVQRWGQVPLEDLEGTLNMGVGFVVILPGADVAAAVRRCADHGIGAWALGTVSATETPPAGAVQGTKGTHGGSAKLVGDYR